MADFTAAGDLLRHPRRADDPLLHLLLDVRLPAHRRPGLGLRRRPRPRLPDGRHRRPHHAHRRGAAARRRAQPHPGQHRAQHARPTIPAFAYELAIIVREGIRRMYGEPRRGRLLLPDPLQRELGDAAQARWRRGGRRCAACTCSGRPRRARAASSCWGRARSCTRPSRAQQLLAERYDVAADVWSVPSFQQLRNDALEAERWNRLHPEAEARMPYVVQQLGQTSGPIIAATDYLKSLPDMVAPLDRPARSPCWGPMASAAATRARRCASTSR